MCTGGSGNGRNHPAVCGRPRRTGTGRAAGSGRKRRRPAPSLAAEPDRAASAAVSQTFGRNHRIALASTRTACYNTNNFRAKQKLPKGSFLLAYWLVAPNLSMHIKSSAVGMTAEHKDAIKLLPHLHGKSPVSCRRRQHPWDSRPRYDRLPDGEYRCSTGRSAPDLG